MSGPYRTLGIVGLMEGRFVYIGFDIVAEICNSLMQNALFKMQAIDYNSCIPYYSSRMLQVVFILFQGCNWFELSGSCDKMCGWRWNGPTPVHSKYVK